MNVYPFQHARRQHIDSIPNIRSEFAADENLGFSCDGQDSEMKWGFDNLEFGKHSWKKTVWEKKDQEDPMKKRMRDGNVHAVQFDVITPQSSLPTYPEDQPAR